MIALRQINKGQTSKRDVDKREAKSPVTDVRESRSRILLKIVGFPIKNGLESSRRSTSLIPRL